MTNTDRLEKLALSVLSDEAGKAVEGLDVLNAMYKKQVWLERGYKRLINEAAGKSRRDIEEMRVREKPKEDISTGMKRQPALNCEPQPQTAAAPAPAVPTPAPPPVSKNIPIEIRSPNRHAYRTMLSSETREGYQRVQDLSGKNDEEIFADMVKVYEAGLLKRKHAQVEKPQAKARPRQDEQDIPVRAHNLYQAKLELGAAYVTNAIAKKRKAPTRTGADSPMLFTFTNEVRDPRATYAPSPPGKRRRGPVPRGSVAVHAAMKRSRDTKAPSTPAWSRPSRRNAAVSQ